jgi:hypothetical protein
MPFVLRLEVGPPADGIREFTAGFFEAFDRLRVRDRFKRRFGDQTQAFQQRMVPIDKVVEELKLCRAFLENSPDTVLNERTP